MIAFVADAHIGNHRVKGGPVVAGMNDRARECVDVLLRAVLRSNEANADAFVILGDLFDTVRPTPQMMTAVQQALAQSACPVYILMGNHDQESIELGDHALGPLDAVSNVTVIEMPCVISVGDVDLYMLPFRVEAAWTWVLPTLGGLAEGKRTAPGGAILCLHTGLSTDADPDYMRACHDQHDVGRLMDDITTVGMSTVIAGNWHRTKTWGLFGSTVNVPATKEKYAGDCMLSAVQCGALCPTGWDNSGLHGYGSLWFWDQNSLRHLAKFQSDALNAFAVLSCWRREEIAGPRFVSGRISLCEANCSDIDHHFYIRFISESASDRDGWASQVTGNARITMQFVPPAAASAGRAELDKPETLAPSFGATVAEYLQFMTADGRLIVDGVEIGEDDVAAKVLALLHAQPKG